MSAQTAPAGRPGSSLAATLARPISLQSGIGHSSERASTSSGRAQAFYGQGLSLLHSFVWVDAARSFNEALKLDPGLTLAYVGLSVADVELNDAAAARDALAHARTAGAKAPARDRTRVDLRAAQMAAEAAPADKALLGAYRSALDRADAQYPNDAELWLLRGMAESSDPAERGQGSTASAIPFYEKARALAPTDDAPHHLLAHAYENSGREDEARREAVIYATMAPAVPHAQHMLGHAAQRTGHMPEAIAAFEAADRLGRAHLAHEEVTADHEWHFEHNLDLLGGAYAYVGRMHDAERVLKEAFDLPTTLIEQGFNKRNWPEFLIARGRPADAAAAADALARYPSAVVTATGHMERARSLMALHEFSGAASEANAALRDMRSAPDGAGLVAPAYRATQGEFLLRTNDPVRGRQMLDEFAASLRARPGPDTWIDGLFALEHVAGAARDAGRWDVAGWAAGEMRAYDSGYGGTHFASALNAQHDGDAQGGRSEFAAAARAWAAGDQDFPSLVRARKESQ